MRKAQGERVDKRNQPGSLPYIWRRISKNPSAMIGLTIFCVIIILSFLSPYILKYDYREVDMTRKCMAPNLEHLFGCDDTGRDILARVLYGARYTIGIGVGAVALAVVVGVIVGVFAGYVGGAVDTVVMRILDVFQSFPGLVFAIAVATALGTGVGNTILAIGIAYVPTFARLMRANIISIRDAEFMEAACTINCSTLRKVRKHLLPNAVAPLIVQVSLMVAHAGITASSMSFLGLGVKEPTPEWGAMIATARTFIRQSPHMVLFPGLFIVITVVSLNLIGDALRDALDPKLRD